MATVFEQVIKLAAEDPVWIPAVAAGYEFAQAYGNHFAGSWIIQKTGWLPNLKPLVTRGILTKAELTRGGSRRYYSLNDPSEVGRALQQLGVTITKGGV